MGSNSATISISRLLPGGRRTSAVLYFSVVTGTLRRGGGGKWEFIKILIKVSHKKLLLKNFK